MNSIAAWLVPQPTASAELQIDEAIDVAEKFKIPKPGAQIMVPVYLRVLIPCWTLEQAELGSNEYQRDIRAYCGMDDSILTLPNLPPLGTSILVRTPDGDTSMKVVLSNSKPKPI